MEAFNVVLFLLFASLSKQDNCENEQSCPFYVLNRTKLGGFLLSAPKLSKLKTMEINMEFKKLNSEVIKLFDKLNKSFDNKSASLNERVNILDHKIDHIISFFDHINYQSRVSNNSRLQRNKKIIN